MKAATGVLAIALIGGSLGTGGVRSVAAQERVDAVTIRTARFWRGEGKTLVEAVIGVPVRAGEGQAIAHVAVSVRDAGGKVLLNETWADTISDRLVAAARTRSGIEKTTPISFAVQPGTYTVTAVVTRAAVRDSAQATVVGFAAQPLISDVLVTSRVRALAEKEPPTAAETRKGRYAIERGTRVTIFPTDPRLSYYVELYPAGSAPISAQLEFTITRAAGGDPLFRTQRAISVGERGGVDIAALPVTGLPPGDYVLGVTARVGDRTERHDAAFTMGTLQDAPVTTSAGATRGEAELLERYFVPAARTDQAVNQLIEALSLASPGEPVAANTMQLPIDAKRRFLARFWSRLPDPKPETPAHEMLEEYADRVAFVGREYVEKDIGRSGPRTDRGRIYLKYGPPDAKQLLPMTGNRAVEVWKYTRNRGLKFAFLDETGFSNFNLVYTTDPNERNLADWQDRVRDVETIRFILGF